MKKMFFSALVISAFALTAHAETKKPSKASAPNVKMDVTGEIKWTGYGVGKSHAGTIPVKAGSSIEVKGTDVVGGTIVLDMTQLKTPDSPRLEAHLKSVDFFEVEKNKEATFKITKVEAIKDAKAGAPTHKITGDLTIKGKTNSQEVLATITHKDKKYTAAGTSQIADRTKYDIVYNSAKFKAASALGDKLIEDKIDISLDLTTK